MNNVLCFTFQKATAKADERKKEKWKKCIKFIMEKIKKIML